MQSPRRERAYVPSGTLEVDFPEPLDRCAAAPSLCLFGEAPVPPWAWPLRLHPYF